MSRATSSGKCSAPARSRIVVLGWAPEATIGARISSPSARVTPTTRPSRTSIEATGALVRISAPAASAERAIAWLIAPMPPITWPQPPEIPSISPSAWWSRL